MTNSELLRNAVWVCSNAAELHRLTNDVCTLTQSGFPDESLAPYMRRMQMILEAADNVIAANKRHHGRPNRQDGKRVRT